MESKELKFCANGGCGVRFSPSRDWQIYCSRKCRFANHNNKTKELLKELQSVICPHCEMEFSVKQIKENKK